MTLFDQLQLIFRQNEESQNIQDLNFKNRLRGGGCQVCKCQNNNEKTKQEISYKKQLEIVRKKIKATLQQQEVSYITPLINITIGSSLLEEPFNEEKIIYLFATKEQDIYWLFGLTKSGKTTLTMKLIDYLWKNTDWIPIYFKLTQIEERNENASEFLKTTLKYVPYNFTDQQIQAFLNEDEKLIIFLDYFDQMNLEFRNNNIIDMLGYENKKINQKLVIITRKQVQDLPAYQPLDQRMIQIELKEFNEDQKKIYIEHLMNQEIQSKININVQQMISIDFNNGQLLIKEEHVRQIKLQLTQNNQQSINQMKLNMEQLNFIMENIFVPYFSFHYQFKLLQKLIKNSQSSQQRVQEQNKTQDLIAYYQKKIYEQLMNRNSSSEELIEIVRILDIIMKFNQEYRQQQGDMLIKQIINPQFTKYKFINSLVDQYIDDSIKLDSVIYSREQIDKEKVREVQTNLALQEQQDGSSLQRYQNPIIKRFCLLTSDGKKEIFLDQKIFKDFFIANAVYIEINQFINDQSKEKLNKFNKFNLCQNDYTEAVALLLDQLVTMPDIKKLLIQLIKLSIGDSNYIISQSNSMYLLSNLKLNLEGEDLCDIHISNIKIPGLSFYYASLCNSHWNNVDLSYCNFNQANLTGAELKDIIGILEIEISEYLQLKEKSKIVGVLDPPSSSIWNNINSKESQNLLFRTYEYFSFLIEKSQSEVSSEQNNPIQENKESQIYIIDYEKNNLINTLKFKQHCSSFCFFTSEDVLICSLSTDQIKYKINIWKYKQQSESKLQEIEQQFDKISKMATYHYDQILVLLINNNTILWIPLEKSAEDDQYKLKIENKTEFNADNFMISNCHKFLAVQYSNEVKIYDCQMEEIQKFSCKIDWWRLVVYKGQKVIFEKPQYTKILDQQIKNAQYSPDGQYVVIQFESKTAFQKINTDTTFKEIEKVNNLIFSNKQFATSSDQGIKIYSFPKCDLLDWLPFKAQYLIFSYKQEQNLAIISDFNFILDSENIEQPPPKIWNVNQEIQDSSLIIAVSTDNKYMTIAQNNLILFIQDQVYKDKKEQYQDETILSMCFTKTNNHLAIRSKKNKQHIFRIINFQTQKTILEWIEDNQTEDTEFSNQISCLLIQNRTYIISNQNNRLVLQDVTTWCDNQNQNENNERKKPPIILELTHQENEILDAQLREYQRMQNQQIGQEQTLNMVQLIQDIPIEQILFFNFSISQDQNYIAACFSQEKKFEENVSTIIIWKYNDKSPFDYEFEQQFFHEAGTNLFFLQCDNLLLLTFKDQEQQFIQLISIENKNKTFHCRQESKKTIQFIVFSSIKEQLFYTIHSKKSFSLYEIKKNQQLELELKYYFQETEIPIYFSQTCTHVIYFCQQNIVIRNVDDIIKRKKNFNQNGIQQPIDDNVGICFSDSIMYFNKEDQKIYQYYQDKITKISLGQLDMIINCSQFSLDEKILIIISSKEGKQFLRIFCKNENIYSQFSESGFDTIIYSCKFLTNSSFILITKDILIYEISGSESSLKQQINLLNLDATRLYVKSINVHPNRKDFLTITNSGQTSLYKSTQNQQCKLYKTLSRNFQAEGCDISKLNASNVIKEQFKQLGAVDLEEIIAS